MSLALTHRPSPELVRCLLTYVDRAPIDLARALDQHEGYCEALRGFGLDVRVLDVNDRHADGVFVEDCAVVLDEVTVLTTMGSEVRRAELAAIAPEIERARPELPTVRIGAPARIEGGDVLRVGRTLFVGLSARTDALGIEALTAIASPHGYRVVPVPVRGCLHLKTGCTALSDHTLLVNPAVVDVGPLAPMEIVEVDPAEPFAANVLRLPGGLLMSASHPATVALVRARGLDVVEVSISELEKAEAGLTCMSLLFLDLAGGAP